MIYHWKRTVEQITIQTSARYNKYMLRLSTDWWKNSCFCRLLLSIHVTVISPLVINTCYGYLSFCYQYMLWLSPLLLSIHITVISPPVINACYGYLPSCYQYMLRLSPLLLSIHAMVISPSVINTCYGYLPSCYQYIVDKR